MRVRTPVAMCVAATEATNSADHLSPASAHAMRLAEHELVDMGYVTRMEGFRTKAALEGPKARKRVPNGRCNYSLCPKKVDPQSAKGRELAAEPQLRCGSCKDGHGAYYHLPCFFACHRCHFAG